MSTNNVAGQFIPDEWFNQSKLDETRLQLAVSLRFRRQHAARIVGCGLEVCDRKGAEFEAGHDGVPGRQMVLPARFCSDSVTGSKSVVTDLASAWGLDLPSGIPQAKQSRTSSHCYLDDNTVWQTE